MATFDIGEWNRAERALIISALNYADHPGHSHAREELLNAARHYRRLANEEMALPPEHKHRASCHGAIGELQCDGED
jgi:hypothetical protein